MFVLKIYDRAGNELKEGDFVKVSNGRSFTFFTEVKYLPEENIIAPFQTFTFHSFEKIESIPSNAIKNTTEKRYNIWHIYDENAITDNNSESFNDYLLSWKICERHLESGTFKIFNQHKSQIKLF